MGKRVLGKMGSLGQGIEFRVHVFTQQVLHGSSYYAPPSRLLFNYQGHLCHIMPYLSILNRGQLPSKLSTAPLVQAAQATGSPALRARCSSGAVWTKGLEGEGSGSRWTRPQRANETHTSQTLHGAASLHWGGFRGQCR